MCLAGTTSLIPQHTLFPVLWFALTIKQSGRAAKKGKAWYDSPCDVEWMRGGNGGGGGTCRACSLLVLTRDAVHNFARPLFKLFCCKTGLYTTVTS